MTNTHHLQDVPLAMDLSAIPDCFAQPMGVSDSQRLFFRISLPAAAAAVVVLAAV